MHNRQPTRFLRCAGDDCTVERETRGFEEMIAHLHRYQADVAGAEPRCVRDCCELERAGTRVATLCFAWDAERVSYLAEVRVYR